ncbi:MAG: O-antigen ligase family protein [Candidatus Omnitrophota bacterium]
MAFKPKIDLDRWNSNLLCGVLCCLPFSKTLAEIGVTAVIILWTFHKVRSRTWPVRIPGWALPHALFLGICLFSLFQVPASSLGTGLRGLFKWLEYLAVFWITLDLAQTKQSRDFLIRGFLISMAVVSLNGALQIFTHQDLIRHRELEPGRILRIKSCFPAPNIFAAFLLFAIPLAIEAFQRTARGTKRKMFYGAGAVLFGVMLISTFSRGALIALALAGGLSMLIGRKWKAFAVAAALLAAILAVPVFQQNFLGSLTEKDMSVRERRTAWKVAGRMIEKHPWTGIGINLFNTRYDDFRGPNQKYRGYAHNSYLQLTAETGIPGLLCFILPFFLYFLRRGFRPGAPLELFSEKTALEIALLAFLIQAAGDNHFFGLETSLLFWIFWALLLSLAGIQAGRNSGAEKFSSV